MKEVKFYLDDEEYEEVAQRKGPKSYKHSYLEALGIDYTPPKTGRPLSKAFDVRAYEEKKRQIHLDKIRKYNEEHAADYEANKRLLGIDTPTGSVSGFTLKNQLKKRE